MLINGMNPRIAQVGFYVALVGIFVLALMPGPSVPASTGWDKTDHWLGFFTLSALAAHAYPQQPFWRRIAPVLVGIGILIEIAQWFTPDRDADWHDVLADSVGILAYGLLAALLQRMRQPRIPESG
jgi:VanZ family protein